MDGFSVGKILAGLRNPELYLKKIKQDNIEVNNGSLGFNSALAKPDASQTVNNLSSVMNQIHMNQIASMDRSIYIKNLLGLPQSLGQILFLAQSKTNLLAPNSLLLNNLNQELLKNQKMISELFDETNQIQLNQIQNVQNINNQKDAMILFFSGMIQMSDISNLIQKNSKQAIANLILAMASASKNGMTNEQIRETMAIINSCVSMAEAGNPAQTLKSLMMLYLPWLPLNEGVGFDLEVSSPEGESESHNSKLTVLIQTKNFGNVRGEFILTTSNSVDVLIICSEGFPKKTLLKSLKEESSSYAINTVIDVEAIQPKKAEQMKLQETKVNLSATNEMNPYLLLMAHAFIRNTIFIDSNIPIEDVSSC